MRERVWNIMIMMMMIDGHLLKCKDAILFRPCSYLPLNLTSASLSSLFISECALVFFHFSLFAQLLIVLFFVVLSSQLSSVFCPMLQTPLNTAQQRICFLLDLTTPSSALPLPPHLHVSTSNTLIHNTWIKGIN